MDAWQTLLAPLLQSPLVERYGPRMLEGLWVTVELVALSYFVGMALGLLLALGRQSPRKPLQYFCRGYIYVLRGSPLLAQLFLVYYGMSSFRPWLQQVNLWWFFRDPWYCTVLAFTLNTAAYQAEIFRGSLLAIPKGQLEACHALGLGRATRFFKVVLPQSMLVAIGPLGNELILMVKASAIASLVTIYDLMGVARLAYSRSFDFAAYLWAAVFYLLIVELLRRGLKRVEARLSRHLAG